MLCYTHVILTDQISLPYCFCFLRYWSIGVLQLFVNGCGVTNFETNLIFLIIKPFVPHDQKVKTKS